MRLFHWQCQASAEKVLMRIKTQKTLLLRESRASTNADTNDDGLFDEAFEELCSSCRKQKLEGIDASHVAVLQKAVRDVKEAFGERRAIGTSTVQISDIPPNKKRGRPAGQHRLKAKSENVVKKLMDTGK